MHDRLTPALSPEEWEAAYEPEAMASLGFASVHSELVEAADHGRWHQAMAYANAALPLGDPRRLSHEHVTLLREIAMTQAEPRSGTLRALADAVAAILPPRPSRG